MKPYIQDFTQEKLAEHISPKFRVKQIYKWLYHHYVTSFEEMKNLPKAMREDLAERFDIAPGQTTNFIQPSADSSVLNRVVGNNPSRILGSLNSNGRVFLINQNGVLVGEGATIDTAGFFGSTLNLTDEDFLNGNLRFEGGGAGDFVNRGYIRAAGGHIVLIAPNIENGGVIEVVDGEVLLAAGRSITLAGIDNPSIRFEVTAPENRVVNLGRIIAERGAASLFAGTLRHSGRIRASGLVRNADGSISLVARESVEISGGIEARSDAGGGRIEVRASEVTLTDSGRIDASAQGEGDGGEVILFADDRVSVQGEILARGGELGGDGGFIETSGLKRLDIGRAPDASAPNGVAGTWLIDPNDITIDTALNNAIDTNISQSGGDFSSTDDGAVLTVETIQTALDPTPNVKMNFSP
jgi:filamentous hemagglutinin family protein